MHNKTHGKHINFSLKQACFLLGDLHNQVEFNLLSKQAILLPGAIFSSLSLSTNKFDSTNLSCERIFSFSLFLNLMINFQHVSLILPTLSILYCVFLDVHIDSFSQTYTVSHPTLSMTMRSSITVRNEFKHKYTNAMIPIES